MLFHNHVIMRIYDLVYEIYAEFCRWNIPMVDT